jgi:hypothetical protein
MNIYNKFKTWFQEIKIFTEILSHIAVIFGVIFAIFQFYIAVDTLKETKEIESGKFILDFGKYIDTDDDQSIRNAIEDHDENFPLLKKRGGKFSDNDIEGYVGKFETIGDFDKRGIINHSMAYNELSYSIEKAWCNNDIKRHIDDVRRNDGGRNSKFFVNFENLANSFLKKDNKEDCKNLN